MVPKPFFSPEATSLLEQLLDKNPATRLGTKDGSSAIRSHNFFSDIDWDKIARKEVVPIFLPDVGPDKLKYFEKVKQESIKFSEVDVLIDSDDEKKLSGFSYNSNSFLNRANGLDNNDESNKTLGGDNI